MPKAPKPADRPASSSSPRAGDSHLSSLSASAESAREQVREEFRQLRAGIEKSLQALDDGSLSAG